MGFITDALQFIVAGYALRVNRIFGLARVGWTQNGCELSIRKGLSRHLKRADLIVL
jgi:hypothetical protein